MWAKQPDGLGTIRAVDVLLVSAEESSREQMALTVGSIRRRVGEEIRFSSASDGRSGIRAALRNRPQLVVADEITSNAGAFALAKELRGDPNTFRGTIVILLERKQDAWLAHWSGADAWFVKPVDPFELADRVLELVTAKETA